ncbi:MAG: DUF5929 domain-containing protein, partial [Bacteroidota bacterium]|nr:DUF5929 domain-containing protein [Bacteroidota bacterium]
LTSDYKVFKEQFVVCWAGNKKKVKNKIYYSRVDIELINEQVKLFYSALDEITIEYNEDTFSTVEYVQLGLGTQQKYYPLEEMTITFSENGKYTINSRLIFEPPQFDKKTLYHVFNANNSLLKKLESNIPLTASEHVDVTHLPATYLICYLNGFEEAKDQMDRSREILKEYDRNVYLSLKESQRILRKVKYS